MTIEEAIVELAKAMKLLPGGGNLNELDRIIAEFTAHEEPAAEPAAHDA